MLYQEAFEDNTTGWHRVANDNGIMDGGSAGNPAWDKVPSKFAGWDEARFREAGFRVVPGAVARQGAYIGKGVVLMPSFVNIGARVDEGSMVDTWATVGSCAQIGKNVHLSGGVGIGGDPGPDGQGWLAPARAHAGAGGADEGTRRGAGGS